MYNYYPIPFALQPFKLPLYQCSCQVHQCQMKIVQLSEVIMKLNEENIRLRQIINERKLLEEENNQIQLLNQKQYLESFEFQGETKEKVEQKEQETFTHSQLVLFSQKLKQIFDERSQLIQKWEKIQNYLLGFMKSDHLPDPQPIKQSRKTIVNRLNKEECSEVKEEQPPIKNQGDDIMDKLLIKQL